jgi:glucan phosphoethanolaminetransferase (alkaline phosphatase superfamily)
MTKKVNKKVSKERHWGITVLGILGYIGAVVTFLAGLAMLIFSAYVKDMLDSITTTAEISSMITALGTIGFIILGIIFIGLAILDYFIAKGLLNGKNWARIIMIVFAALGILGSIQPFSIINLIIDGIIIWYLGFYKPAINYFK